MNEDCGFGCYAVCMLSIFRIHSTWCFVGEVGTDIVNMGWDRIRFSFLSFSWRGENSPLCCSVRNISNSCNYLFVVS